MKMGYELICIKYWQNKLVGIQVVLNIGTNFSLLISRTELQTNLDIFNTAFSLNSRDLFLNLRRLVKMTKPLRFENKSLRLKYKCLICILIIFEPF